MGIMILQTTSERQCDDWKWYRSSSLP